MAIPTEKPSYGPLDGVKVVYAAVELACPKAADLMADWGADVTWLENTGAGDTIRDTAYIKQAERRNQRSVALNYFSEEGREKMCIRDRAYPFGDRWRVPPAHCKRSPG